MKRPYPPRPLYRLPRSPSFISLPTPASPSQSTLSTRISSHYTAHSFHLFPIICIIGFTADHHSFPICLSLSPHPDPLCCFVCGGRVNTLASSSLQVLIFRYLTVILSVLFVYLYVSRIFRPGWVMIVSEEGSCTTYH